MHRLPQIKKRAYCSPGYPYFFDEAADVGDLALTIGKVLDRNRTLYSAAGNR